MLLTPQNKRCIPVGSGGIQRPLKGYVGMDNFM